MESLCELKSEICRRVEEIGRRAVEEPLKEAATASGVTNSKIRSRMQDALDAAVMSLTRFLSALKTLIPLTDICFVQSMLPQLWRVMKIRLPRTSAMACDVPRAVLDPNSAVQLKRETVEEILFALVQHVEGTPTESHELSLSLAFVEPIYSGFARFHDQDLSLSQETLSCILPSLVKQVGLVMSRKRKEVANACLSCLVAFRVRRDPRSGGEREDESPWTATGDNAMTLKSGTPSKKSSTFGAGRSTKSRTTKISLSIPTTRGSDSNRREEPEEVSKAPPSLSRTLTGNWIAVFSTRDEESAALRVENSGI